MKLTFWPRSVPRVLDWQLQACFSQETDWLIPSFKVFSKQEFFISFMFLDLFSCSTADDKVNACTKSASLSSGDFFQSWNILWISIEFGSEQDWKSEHSLVFSSVGSTLTLSKIKKLF